ncbi:MAG TPA: SCO family protein [Myxococcota bacterium]|nr:SCO family protein [Myxococcota bacterium]
MKQFLPIAIALVAILLVVGVILLTNKSDFGSEVVSQTEDSLLVPKEIKMTEIEDKAGTKVPLDIELINENGQEILLGDYFKDGDMRPVIITMLYYGCPRLCSLVLNGEIDAFKKIGPRPGKDFRMIAVSIDERETFDLAAQKGAVYREALELKPQEKDAWIFHVAKKEQSERLAKALGFNYFYDKRDDQFGHGAGLFFVASPSGMLARTLFGIEFKPNDVKLALSEASEGKVGTSLLDRVILSCFHYDPDSHRYGIYVMGVMRLSGILTLIILGTFLLIYFRGERKRALMG